MKQRTWWWAGAIVAGLILIVLLWPARPPAPGPAPAVSPAEPVVKIVHHLKRPLPEPPAAASVEPPAAPPAETNAAAIYRDAFARFDALSKPSQEILSGGRTNADAGVVAELCAELGPICELLHRAAAVTNCDWGLGPLAPDTRLPHLGPARALGRAAIWSAAHCRGDDAAAATEDVLATLRLGQQVGHGAAMIGYLVAMKLQEMGWSYVAQNLDRFRGADGQRLAAAIDDLAYDDAFSRAVEQEGEFVDRFATKLASLSPEDASKQVAGLGDFAADLDPASAIEGLRQVADLQRALSKILATGSDADYEAWHRRAEELQTSNVFLKEFLPSPKLVEKAQRFEVNRALIEAGLAVAAKGAAGLAAYPDPSTGKEFTYREVPGGFELESSYQVNQQPLKTFFPQTATRQQSR